MSGGSDRVLSGIQDRLDFSFRALAMGLQVLHCAKGVHFHAISAEISGKIVV